MCEKTCEVSGCFHECQQLATHQSALRAKHSYLATDINAAEVASNLSYMHRHRQTAVRGLNTFHGPLCPWSHLSGSFEAFLSACCLEPFFPACFSLSWPACLYPPLACHLCNYQKNLAFAASKGTHWAAAYSAVIAEQQHLLCIVQLEYPKIS